VYIVNALINVKLRHTCFKGVFLSFLRASHCAGVPKPQHTGVAGSNPTGGLIEKLLIYDEINIVKDF